MEKTKTGFAWFTGNPPAPHGFIRKMPASLGASFFLHMKRLAFFTGFAAAAAMSMDALAGGEFSPMTSSITLPTQITVAGNLPAGSTLWKSPVVTLSLSAAPLAGTTESGKDISSSEIHGRIQGASKAPGYKDVYSTNVAGLGVRWSGTWRAPNFPGGITMPITTPNENTAGAAGWTWFSPSRAQDVWIELVKTGDIAGGLLANQAMNAYLQFQCAYTCTAGTVKLAGSTQVVTGPSCSVANTAIPVALGSVFARRFTGVGSTSTPQPFEITLNCRGGATGSKLLPHVTLTDANNASNRSTTLTLSPSQGSNSRPAATGVGIQIQKDGVPLGYGPDSNTPGNTNQWSAGTIDQGVAQFRIALTASYVQTAASITPGPANGKATFTLSYQ